MNYINIIKTHSILVATLFCLFVSACNTTSEKSTQNDIPQLEERTGELAKAAEWEKTKLKVAELTEQIKAKPADVKPRLQLATIYMSESRITGNPYYNQATVKVLDGVLAIDPSNFEATTYKASIAMSLHQFAEAKKLAEKAKTINPNNAYVYGVLVDADVELGNYNEAIAMSDKMQSIKPSLESYSRASYIREIFGDYNGAIEAMQMAVKAGVTGSESGEWARVTLGDIYLNMGKLDSAANEYKSSLIVRPNFPTAFIGLAKIEKLKKNYPAAIAHVESAIRIVSEASYVSLLGELYGLKGDSVKANEIRNDVIDLLEKAEDKLKENTVMAHNGNREFANAYMQNKNYTKALEYANNDLALRPENIDANELVAWILFLKGDYTNAKIHADKMLLTNTMNANTIYKAGLIYTKVGDATKGKAMCEKALASNSFIDPSVLAYNL